MLSNHFSLKIQFGIVAFFCVFAAQSIAWAGGTGGGGSRDRVIKECADHWGNKAKLNLSVQKVTIVSSRYGRSGVLKANGNSGSSLYFRNGMGDLAIVNKSILSTGQGRVVWRQNINHDDPEISVRLTCN